MDQAQRLADLNAESATLDRLNDAPRLREIYAEAATLVDRSSQLKRWGAYRYLYGQLSETVDPESSLLAYRDSLPVWDPASDRNAWVSCNLSLGLLLATLGRNSTSDAEQVIACLEAAVEDYPFCASTLAVYYAFRTLGDPVENWRCRLRYLQLAETQIPPDQDPVRWACLHNDVGNALAAEPNGDYVKGMEARRLHQQEALALLSLYPRPDGSPAQSAWIRINIDLSESWQFCVSSDTAESVRQAEQHAREAFNACSDATPADVRANAMLGLARVLTSTGDGPERALEALSLCQQAEHLVDAKSNPVQFSTVAKFRALSYNKLLRLGVPDTLAPLVQAAETAYTAVDPNIFLDHCRTVMFIAADALVWAGEPVRAISFWERAIALGEKALQQATSRAGRLERIFDLHDWCAILGYCRLHTGAIVEAIAEIDQGKSRLWRSAESTVSVEALAALVPPNGALLFPVFAPRGGAVALFTATQQSIVWLPAFGRERLNELLVAGLPDPASTSWIGLYCFRNSNPAAWFNGIDAIGAVLYREFWAPLLEQFPALGIAEGAELVIFPQGGLGGLPLHSAWTEATGARQWIADKYAFRYAPSVASLSNSLPQRSAKPALAALISDPAGDLSASGLEMHWAVESLAAQDKVLLPGSAATKQAILDVIPRATLLHLSTHAVFRVDDPFSSGVLAAEGESLSIDELLPHLAQSPPREVILSACETAMTQVWRRADELLGFPSLFLEHGTRTVLATLWPVDDLAAATLVGRFYHEWQVNAKAPAQAINAAARWLREATVKEVSDLLRTLKADPGPVGAAAASIRSQLIALDPAEKHFAHPFYWAAFTISGH